MPIKNIQQINSEIDEKIKPGVLSITDLQESKHQNQIVTSKEPTKSKIVSDTNKIVARNSIPEIEVPTWHAPWELSAVISGHLGWVRAISFDSSNEWFATGSADRTIKIWDLAKCCTGSEGGLKLTLTGHISAVRGLAVSPRHPYLFSVGEDKLVKCIFF